MNRIPGLDEALLQRVVALSREAGAAILEVYRQTEAIEVETKADDSPVTAADLAAHRILVGTLATLLEGVPVLSEEGKLPSWEERRAWTTYWIIDPLDGTKEFIKRNGEFTVNVALVHEGEPLLGVVYVPVQDLVYCGLRGVGARKISAGQNLAIHCRSIDSLRERNQRFTLVASRRHGTEKVNQLIKKLETTFGELDTMNMGSSLKLCLVAEGKADLYPRLAPTCEWDTAAAHAIVEAAGGQVYKYDLEILRYNTKEELLNPWFYVVGDPGFTWQNLLQE